jgi:hypothetical protein
LIGVAIFNVPFSSRCVSTTNPRVETEVIGVQTSCIMAWLQLVIFDVPFSICRNSTTNPAIDAKIIALERSCSGLLNDIFYVSILVFKRKLSGFKQVVSGLGFDC